MPVKVRRGFIRATHARPLHPAALASVPFGIVLVRVRVRRGFMGDDVGYALQDGHTFRPQIKEAPLALEPGFIPRKSTVGVT